jgi:hypothetical protein
MKPRKKPKCDIKQKRAEQRNRSLHIPLDFETAVEGLLNVKPKKKQPKK